MTTVVINDFETDRRLAILFNHPQDFQRVDTYSEAEDKLLVELSEANEIFGGKRQWCDLTPTHFRFLIMENLNKMSALTDEQQADPTDPTMQVSVDGGAHWGRMEQLWLPTPLGGTRRAVAADITHVRWSLPQAVPPGHAGRLSYRATMR